MWAATMNCCCKGFTVPAASGNDYQKEQQFKKINSQKDSIEVAVVRSGKQIVVKNTDIIVGDVLSLNTGDKVSIILVQNDVSESQAYLYTSLSGPLPSIFESSRLQIDICSSSI